MVIYKTTNLVNGKQYIGRDRNNNPNYLGSGICIKNAIKKYGKQNFKKEILEECSSFEHLMEREEYWLNYYDAGTNPNFYNMHNRSLGFSARGVDHYNFGKKLSPEHKEKLTQSRKGKRHSEESIQKMKLAQLGEKHHFYGKRHNEETRRKIAESLRGVKHSEERTSKRIGVKRQIQFSDEGRQRLRESHMGENNLRFKGYVICVSGQYVGQRKSIREWTEILKTFPSSISSHLSGRSYKKGIRGNILKWENEL
jgi:group I intron endonuclease